MYTIILIKLKIFGKLFLKQLVKVIYTAILSEIFIKEFVGSLLKKSLKYIKWKWYVKFVEIICKAMGIS
jgi:hypothetical protein